MEGAPLQGEPRVLEVEIIRPMSRAEYAKRYLPDTFAVEEDTGVGRVNPYESHPMRPFTFVNIMDFETEEMRNEARPLDPLAAEMDVQEVIQVRKEPRKEDLHAIAVKMDFEEAIEVPKEARKQIPTAEPLAVKIEVDDAVPVSEVMITPEAGLYGSAPELSIDPTPPNGSNPAAASTAPTANTPEAIAEGTRGSSAVAVEQAGSGTCQTSQPVHVKIETKPSSEELFGDTTSSPVPAINIKTENENEDSLEEFRISPKCNTADVFPLPKTEIHDVGIFSPSTNMQSYSAAISSSPCKPLLVRKIHKADNDPHLPGNGTSPGSLVNPSPVVDAQYCRAASITYRAKAEPPNSARVSDQAEPQSGVLATLSPRVLTQVGRVASLTLAKDQEHVATANPSGNNTNRRGCSHISSESAMIQCGAAVNLACNIQTHPYGVTRVSPQSNVEHSAAAVLSRFVKIAPRGLNNSSALDTSPCGSGVSMTRQVPPRSLTSTQEKGCTGGVAMEKIMILPHDVSSLLAPIPTQSGGDVTLAAVSQSSTVAGSLLCPSDDTSSSPLDQVQPCSELSAELQHHRTASSSINTTSSFPVQVQPKGIAVPPGDFQDCAVTISPLQQSCDAGSSTLLQLQPESQITTPADSQPSAIASFLPPPVPNQSRDVAKFPIDSQPSDLAVLPPLIQIQPHNDALPTANLQTGTVPGSPSRRQKRLRRAKKCGIDSQPGNIASLPPVIQNPPLGVDTFETKSQPGTEASSSSRHTKRFRGARIKSQSSNFASSPSRIQNQLGGVAAFSDKLQTSSDAPLSSSKKQINGTDTHHSKSKARDIASLPSLVPNQPFCVVPLSAESQPSSVASLVKRAWGIVIKTEPDEVVNSPFFDPEQIPGVDTLPAGLQPSTVASTPRIAATGCHRPRKTCSICGKDFCSSNAVLRHMRIHTGERPFSCKLCHRGFNQAGILKRHMITHTSAKPFTCDECDQTFSFKGSLARHSRIHTNAKPFSCSECGRQFSDSGNMRKHERKAHTAAMPFYCYECRVSFKDQQSLQEHRDSHESTAPFVCEDCGRRFTCKFSLREHVKIHGRGKPFICGYCRSRFASETFLNKHMKKWHGKSVKLARK